MIGQPIFQLEKNQYQELEIEGWKNCFYYEIIPVVPLAYIPNGDVDLLWNADGIVRLGSVVPMVKGTIGLQRTGQLFTLPPENRKLYGIHISAGYQNLFYIEAIEEWLQQIVSCESFRERASCCSMGFSKYLPQTSAPPFVVYALEQMRKNHGRVVVENLAVEYGYTPRQLQRLFQDIYGCTPKRMCQYIRLLSAVERMEMPSETSFAAISEQLGYADPSHFHREFKRFFRMTPGKFMEIYFS